jgi:hypothetical protein
VTIMCKWLPGYGRRGSGALIRAVFPYTNHT